MSSLPLMADLICCLPNYVYTVSIPLRSAFKLKSTFPNVIGSHAKYTNIETMRAW